MRGPVYPIGETAASMNERATLSFVTHEDAQAFRVAAGRIMRKNDRNLLALLLAVDSAGLEGIPTLETSYETLWLCNRGFAKRSESGNVTITPDGVAIINRLVEQMKEPVLAPAPVLERKRDAEPAVSGSEIWMPGDVVEYELLSARAWHRETVFRVRNDIQSIETTSRSFHRFCDLGLRWRRAQPKAGDTIIFEDTRMPWFVDSVISSVAVIGGFCRLGIKPADASFDHLPQKTSISMSAHGRTWRYKGESWR